MKIIFKKNIKKNNLDIINHLKKFQENLILF